MEKIKKIRKKKYFGIIGNTIGFCILLGIMSIFSFIFITIAYSGGIILYEPNRFIIILEIIVIFTGFIFLIYLFKKKLWDDKF